MPSARLKTGLVVALCGAVTTARAVAAETATVATATLPADPAPTPRPVVAPSRWAGSFDLRLDVPTTSLAGIGVAWTAGMRVRHPLGPVSGFGALTFGWASCRADCPDFAVRSSADGGVLEGIFGHAGVEAGVDRRLPLGRWALDIGGGGRASYFHLSADQGFAGPTNAFAFGPFASVRLVSPPRPLASSSGQRLGSGPELVAAWLTTLGRAPAGRSWVLGVGWSWTFEGPPSRSALQGPAVPE